METRIPWIPKAPFNRDAFRITEEITRLRLSQSAVPPADNWRRGNDFRWAEKWKREREKTGWRGNSKGGKPSRRRKRGDKDTRIYVRKRMRKGRIYFVRHLRLAAHGLHPISLFLPNNFTNGHSTFVCLTFHVFQPSSHRSLSLFGRDVGAGDSQSFGGEKNSVRRGWKFFFTLTGL